ncbi:MAG TPA: hypothetical protein VNW46_03910 [Gemmatimonadaceae bacterium]|nr:hypothetical protein [Gemmatimonadaceae bacterium]
MDIRVPAVGSQDWLELRDARPADELSMYRAMLRVQVDGEVYHRPFWFDRGDLDEFAHDLAWLDKSVGGSATLNHAGRPEYVTVVIESSGRAMITGELFDFENADAHVRFSLPQNRAGLRELLRDVRTLLDGGEAPR